MHCRLQGVAGFVADGCPDVHIADAATVPLDDAGACPRGLAKGVQGRDSHDLHGNGLDRPVARAPDADANLVSHLAAEGADLVVRGAVDGDDLVADL